MGLEGGYVGQILRVNLGKKSLEKAKIPERMLQQFLGGRGLGIKMLWDETAANTGAFDPSMVLMFWTGPYTGTGVFSAFFNVTTRSPLTGLAASAHSGGEWGPYLKMAGFDGIVISGRADDPCYLLVENGEPQILEGKDLWGKGVLETTIILENRHKRGKVAAIGPAGENLVRFASIMNDGHRAIGRGGVGAVMGSKKLKAIVVKGSQSIRIADPKSFSSLSQQGGKKAVANAPAFAKYGTSLVLGLMNEKGALPTRNFSAGRFEEASFISGEALKRDFYLKDKGCYHCPLRCANINQVKSGSYLVEETEGPEYETLMAFGSNCGNSNLASIVKANHICNDLGLDTISTGCTIALMMDLYERKVIDQKMSGGLDLAWGNHKALVELIPKIGFRNGLGDLLAEGSLRAAQQLGEKAVKRVIHTKGQEFPGYEPRRAYGTGLSFATGNRGACHLRGCMYVNEIFTGQINPIGYEGKPELLKSKEDFMALVDSLVMCKFGQRNGEFTPAVLTEVLKALTGANYTEESLLETGERIWNMERLYNLREKEIEDILPDRFFQEDLEDSLEKGERISLREFERAKTDYYRLRGWDETGRPYSQTLKNLGI